MRTIDMREALTEAISRAYREGRYERMDTLIERLEHLEGVEHLEAEPLAQCGAEIIPFPPRERED